MARRGSLSAALLKQGKPRKALYLKGARTNTVLKGQGSQRRGQDYRVGYDPRKRRFFHDYGQGRPTVYIKRANALHAQYRSKFGLPRLQRANRALKPAPKPRGGRGERTIGYGGGEDSTSLVYTPSRPARPPSAAVGPNPPRRRRRT